MKKSLITAALFGACLAPLAATAQTPPADVASALKVGAAVYGPQGEEVGTIESMPSGNVVIFTGTNRATLPPNVFGKNDKGLIISMTKAQLDAAVEAAEAKADATMEAALVADAEVKSKDGIVIGSVQKLEGNNVTLDLADGKVITLTKDALTADQTGLKLFMTATEFNAAVAAATSSATAATTAGGEAASAETAATESETAED